MSENLYIVSIFSIRGNHRDPEANPVPCPRTTHQGRFTKKAKEYMLWRDYVQSLFAGSLDHLHAKISTSKAVKDIFLRIKAEQKPIAEYSKAHVKLTIHFVNKKGKYPHPDCDNVLKGILDALFEDDNRVAFSVDFTENNKRGSIDVEVGIKF
jgi:Holliday junction resolvase RusA-like endonuclease